MVLTFEGIREGSQALANVRTGARKACGWRCRPSEYAWSGARWKYIWGEEASDWLTAAARPLESRLRHAVESLC